MKQIILLTTIILTLFFISNSAHAQVCTGNFVTSCYELLNETSCNLDFTNYIGNYYQCAWTGVYCAPVSSCELTSSIYTYSCVGTYSMETLVSQNGNISSVQIYCPFGCTQLNPLNYHAGGTIPQADLCSPQPRVVNYWCDNGRSYENITGIINSMQCPYGCNQANDLTYHAGSPNIPQADLCNPNPFITDIEIIGLFFGFIILLLIFWRLVMQA